MLDCQQAHGKDRRDYCNSSHTISIICKDKHTLANTHKHIQTDIQTATQTHPHKPTLTLAHTDYFYKYTQKSKQTHIDKHKNKS